MQSAEMSGEWTPERLFAQLTSYRERIRETSVASATTADASGVEAYRRAAAVLAWFDPAQLQPAREPANEVSERPELLRVLLRDCDVSVSRAPTVRWILQPEARRRALSELDTLSEMRRARQANAALPGNPLQSMLDRCIEGDVPDVDGCSLEDLECLLQVRGWLERFQPRLPRTEVIRERLQRQRLLAPFEALAGNFYGRGPELARLRNFVGVLPPDSTLERVRHQMRVWRGQRSRQPIVVHGVGGIGKSTLIAKFILDHASLGETIQIPFVYLDFDSVRLQAERPLSLVVEASRQLALQYPSMAAAFEALAESADAALLPDVSTETLESRVEQQRGFLARLRGLVQRLPGSRFQSEDGNGSLHRPLLVVLDTFEEVQYRTGTQLERLWTFLDQLQESYPPVRVVVSGRAPLATTGALAKRSFDEMEIGDLDTAAAVTFLERAGVTSADIALAVAKQVGGSPLTLKLAARVVGLEGVTEEGIRDLTTRRWLLLSADRAVIQGQLYRRILMHIHDPVVRKLAHPGLVLRRITPELIRVVLAESCDVIVADAAAADELFAELKREVALVTPDIDGSVHHRPDVRRVMLGLIRREKPDQVQRIQEAAVGYYRKRETVVDRAEELYHMLQLETDSVQLSSRWMQGVEPYLAGAIDELGSASAQTFLASHLGIELDSSQWARASLEDNERRIATLVRALLVDGQGSRALELLRPVVDRTPGSPLHLLEAQALVQTGNVNQARQALAKATDAAVESGDYRALLDCTLLSAQLSADAGNFLGAVSDLERGVQLAADLGDPERCLQARVRLLELLIVEMTSGEVVDWSRQDAVVELFSRITDGELERFPLIAGLVGSTVGKNVPDVLVRAVRAGGLIGASQPQLARVAEVVEHVLRTHPPGEFLARIVRDSDATRLPLVAPADDEATPSRWRPEVLVQVIEEYGYDNELRHVVAAAMRPRLQAPAIA